MSVPQLAGAPARRRSATGLGAFWGSTIGKKVVMGTTGLIMAAYLVTHVLANLLAFAGPEKVNQYAYVLHEQVQYIVLWPARLVLLAAVVLHVIAAVQLTRISRAARPVPYGQRDPQVSTFASRTMRVGGVLLFAFIVYHILHFTVGSVHPDFRHLQPYHNVATAFRDPIIAGVYILAMVLIGLHLYHGTWSAFRTLGVAKPSSNPLRRPVALVLSVGIAGGFILVVLGALVGLIG